MAVPTFPFLGSANEAAEAARNCAEANSNVQKWKEFYKTHPTDAVEQQIYRAEAEAKCACGNAGLPFPQAGNDAMTFVNGTGLENVIIDIFW